MKFYIIHRDGASRPAQNASLFSSFMTVRSMLDQEIPSGGLVHAQQLTILSPPRCYQPVQASAEVATESKENACRSRPASGGSEVESPSLSCSSNVKLDSESDSDDAFELCAKPVQKPKPKRKTKMQPKPKPTKKIRVKGKKKPGKQPQPPGGMGKEPATAAR